MRKMMISIITFVIMIALFIETTYAAEEYRFDLQRQGTIIKNTESNAVVLLTGVNGTPYTNVQIKVDITGPAIPQLLATDSAGNEIDIAQIGYWGPTSGFAVGGNFINHTEVRATFSEEGNYTITLSLIDLANSNTVIITKAFHLQVFEDETTIAPENKVEELPKTGTSIWEYLFYLIAITVVLSMIGVYFRSRKIN